MQDLETNSLWSQISGECIEGELKGQKLNQYSAIHITYDDFKSRYPEGMLLSKPAKGDPGSQYKEYFEDQTKIGIFKRVNNFKQLDGKDKVLGINLNDKQFAISLDLLEKKQLVVLTENQPAILVIYNKETETSSAFFADDVKSNEYSIDSDFIISEKDSQSRWLIKTGKALTDGTNDLVFAPVVTSYWFAWISFFPETELLK